MSLTMTDELAEERAAKAGRYLTFVLRREAFGIPVLKVREIIRLPDITPVPRRPAFLKGVINLRGKVLPVVDLGLRFDHAEAELTDRTCVVVVEVSRSEGGCALLGLIVDAVEEVTQVTVENLDAAPDFGGEINTDHILALARVGSGVVTLLDIDKLAAPDAGEKLKAAA